MKTPTSDHRFLALFPPYRGVEPLEHPASIPSDPLPPRGAALIWNLFGDDWGGGFRAVRDRPPGVALFILLPPADHFEGMERLLDLMEHCRPHSVLPHMSLLSAEELVPLLKGSPADLPSEVSEYLKWRGVEVDMDTRRLIRKTLELSGELRTVSGLARSLYVSRRALGRRFMSRGLPVPSHWLHLGRILRASLRLQNPQATLHSVACEMGYPDGFALSNQMHRLTKLRPSVMRECFGWEWIVEAWLNQEALEGNLSPILRRALFGEEPSAPSAPPPRLLATGTGPVRRVNVAERLTPRQAEGRSPPSG
jgi:AraC-like DNA-binding protein